MGAIGASAGAGSWTANHATTSASDAVLRPDPAQAIPASQHPASVALLDLREAPASGFVGALTQPAVQAAAGVAHGIGAFGTPSTPRTPAQPVATVAAAAHATPARAAHAAPRHAAPAPAAPRHAATAPRHAATAPRHAATAKAPAHAARAPRPRLTSPFEIYDSVTPGAIPSGHQVATYSNGYYAASASDVAGRGHVLWIDTNGSNTHADALDVEPGDATPAGAAYWVKAKLSASPRSVAIVYTMISQWQAVKDNVAALPQSMQSHVRYWIADPTGAPHILPGSSATQWYWGKSYDITSAYPGFES
jgi:hypothetical protein